MFIKSAPLLLEDAKMRDQIYKNWKTLVQGGSEKLTRTLELMVRITDSPSQEIQKLKDQLVSQLLTMTDPEAALEKVESIFIRNNLPTMGKVYEIFGTLHPPKEINGKYFSPILTSLGSLTEKRNQTLFYNTIYRDLMKIHVRSDNQSLRSFLTIIKDNQALLERVERNPRSASPEDGQKLGFFCEEIGNLV